MTTSMLLGTVAFSALAMAAGFVPADDAAIASLTATGHGLLAVTWMVDAANRAGPRKRDGAGLITATLGAFAALELAGMLIATREAEVGQATWFGLALSFAVAGLIAAWRVAPSDGAFVAQIGYHSLMVLPLLAATVDALLKAIGGEAAARMLGPSGPLAKTLVIVGGVAMPLLFVTLLAALAYDFNRPADRRNPIWNALLANQAAFVILAVRWSYRGI